MLTAMLARWITNCPFENGARRKAGPVFLFEGFSDRPKNHAHASLTHLSSLIPH